MGVVVSAYHLHLDEHVAIKFLLPQVLADAEAVGRFSREARAAVKIKSEHVARVIDVGTLDTGSPYMVMEYLEGEDLGALVQRHGPLAVPDAVDYVLQASEALAEAHSLGIVHRDLKPANLFLTRRADGSACIKVLDFGISKITVQGASGTDLSFTKTAVSMGSPLYMSPEQMASARDVDARTDIWALGAILFELVAGRVPFDAETMPQLCALVLQEDPPPLRNYAPDAPAGLEEVIRKCLQKKASDRYPTVAEMAHALSRFAPKRSHLSVQRISKVLRAAGLSESKTEVDPSVAPPSHVDSARTQGAWGQTKKTGSRSGTRTAAILAAFLTLAVVGGVWLLSGTSSVPAADSVAPTPSAAPEPPNNDDAPAVAPAARPPQPEAKLKAPAADGTAAAPGSEPSDEKAATPVKPKVNPAKSAAVAKPGAAPRARPSPHPTVKAAAPAPKATVSPAAKRQPPPAPTASKKTRSISDLYGDRK